jgi:hypothetical protein
MANVQKILSELPLTLYGEFRMPDTEYYNETVNVAQVKHTITEIYYSDFKIYGSVNFLKFIPEYDLLVDLFKKRKIVPSIRGMGKYYRDNSDKEKAIIEKIITWDVQFYEQSLRAFDYVENNPKKFFY